MMAYSVILYTYITVVFVLKIANNFPVPLEDDFETEPNFRSGNLISQWNDSWEVNPDELGYYFQGDIITSTTDLRSIINNETLRWPNAVVPYIIVGPYDNEGLGLVEWAMNQYHIHTCIRFKPKEFGDLDYLVITNAFTGCWSSLGRQGGKQEINLQHPGCLNSKRRGTAIHELMHALGIKHEHTRVDRDEHITIITENIRPTRTLNFEKSTMEEATNYDIPYDFESVMHYSIFAFSIDYGKKPTIRPKYPEELIKGDGTKIKMGQRQGFGINDIRKLNRMYCPEGGQTEPGPVVSLKEGPIDQSSSLADWWTSVIHSLQESFN